MLSEEKKLEFREIVGRVALSADIEELEPKIAPDDTLETVLPLLTES